MPKLLIVEDDQTLLDSIVYWLKDQRFTIDSANTAADGVHFLQEYSYDALILDWDLGQDAVPGIELLRDIRGRGMNLPVLMLTGKDDISEKERGLEYGADDYLTKPFEFRELSARLRALLRRAGGSARELLKVGNLELDPATFRLVIGKQEVALQPKEFAILEFFLRNPNTPFTGEALLDRIWPSNTETTVSSVRSYMYTLRKKLSAHGHGDLIGTQAGFGYRLNG